ncbi:MAG: ribonuclease D [Chromatiales bacterium]|nr:ribonuclease D [Gammaproteobacteria bacterium]MBW6477722.1 ribonuclease D [Chromatiales bacterium]
MSALYIDTPTQLDDLCQQLSQAEWFSLDTEFLRESTYRARLCLLQVATPDLVACIDPLALQNLDPLLELLFEPGITKVLHSAHQDLEIFYDLCGKVPGPIFDTQIAATVLGQGEQIGYGALVLAELGIELEKGQARTDWCRRPLEEVQLSYAADDVRHLCQVYLRQVQRLRELGRETWLNADFAALSDSTRYSNPPELAWQRIKGSNRLHGVQIAVLQALAAWREQQARQQDKPRRWILKDEVVLDMARLMPGSLDRLARIRGLDESCLRRHGESLLREIALAKETPKANWPHPKTGPRLPAEQEPLVDVLMALLRERCQQQAISPGAVAGRRDLERLVMGERDLPLQQGWRAAIAGVALQRLLDGELALMVRNGHLEVVEHQD